MKEKLVKDLNYPKEVSALRFDYHRAIRGLVIDRASGNTLKVSRYGMVREAYHGLQRIDYKEQRAKFGTKYIDLGRPNFDCVDTHFSISHACLFSQIVELKKEKKFDLPDFTQVADDLISVLDASHRDGSIKDEVTQNPDKYIKRSEETVRGIKKFKKHGIKFFIATNSDFNYTNKVLTYAIDPFLPEGETWKDFFSYTFTFCMKPRFFYTNLPLLKIDPETGAMKNWEGKIIEGIYQGGSANMLSAALGVNGDNILYVGDHIYGDILMLKKNCGWRTALIVEELGEEIDQNQRAASATTEIKMLMSQKMELEYYLNNLVGDRLEQGINKGDEEKNVIAEIQKLDQKLGPIIQKRNEIYNKYWGPIMRAGVEESQFANQVEGFSDIYMPALTDLLAVSPRTYFRSYIRKMAHD